MKRNVIGLIFIVVVFSILLTAGDTGLEIQKKVAIDYFVKLTGGDVEAANELITVPFSLDLKKVLTKTEEVYEFHNKVVERKGKRDIPEYTAEATLDATKLDPKIFPPYISFRIKMKGHGHLDIYVTTTKDPKVIGFAD